MNLKISNFSAFIAVARHKSFRAAGDELGLTPSAVSHAIKQLEQRLKIQVFNRTTRSVSLTEAGINLYNRLGPAFDEIDAVLDETNDFRTTPMGTLKINTAPIFSRLVLMPLVVGFSQQYPDIKIEVTTDDNLIDIVEKQYDAGIRLSTRLDDDMIAVPIGPPMRNSVVATPAYFDLHSRPEHPSDLTAHRGIILRFKSGRPYHWRFEGPAGELIVNPPGNIIVDDCDSALDAVLSGAGIGYLEHEQVKSHVANGQLISVLEPWLPVLPRLQFYYPRNRNMTCSLRAFIDYIRSH